MDRSARAIGLTPHGAQLLSYGRRLLALNDEVWSRLTDQAFEGQIKFGVPHDIAYPHVPDVLNQFAADYPRAKVRLYSSFTSKLKAMYRDGKIDLILTAEIKGGPDMECLAEARMAYESECLFRGIAQRALDAAGIPWKVGVETRSSRTLEARVSADLAVNACLKGAEPPYWKEVPKSAGLPEVPNFEINRYADSPANGPLVGKLAHAVRRAYGKRGEAAR